MADKYCVAVFGAAVAGSEAVEKMVQNGITVVVFDQNTLPYGKIETGLPKWHVKLRNRQEEKINARLDLPDVHFVPNCTLGKDIDFDDVISNWGFNAVLLATGAWKDRPLPITGIDKFAGKGFYYQNPFVQWFNLYHDPAYTGPHYKIEDNAVIIGGGLASIDVAKIIMIESFRASLPTKCKDLDTITVERMGLAEAAKSVGLTIDQIGLKGCKIYYRRRIIDMPLSAIDENSTEDEKLKGQQVRQKIVKLAEDKYLFKVVECHSPVEAIIKDDKVAGMVMRKNEIKDGKVIPIPGFKKNVSASLVISSIGSIPDIIPGIRQTGEQFEIEDFETGKLKSYENVFVLGNAVTGKGNIKDSQLHGRNVSESIIKNYLGLADTGNGEEIKFNLQLGDQLSPIFDFVKKQPIALGKFQQIMKKIKTLQQKAGYTNYKEWINKNLPVRLEDMQ